MSEITSTYLHNQKLAGSSTHLPPHGEKIEFDAAGHSLNPVDGATALEALTVPGFSRVDAETVADVREALAAGPLPENSWPGNTTIGPPGEASARSESLEGKTVTIKVTQGLDDDQIGSIVRGVVVADSLLSGDAEHPAKATKSPDEEIDGEIAKAERVGIEESAQSNAARGTAPPVSIDTDPAKSGNEGEQQGGNSENSDDPNVHPVDGHAEQAETAKAEVTENTDIAPHTPVQPHVTPQNPVPPGPPVKVTATAQTTAPESASAKKAREKVEKAEQERKVKEAEGLHKSVTKPVPTHDGPLSALAAAEAALNASHGGGISDNSDNSGDLGGQG